VTESLLMDLIDNVTLTFTVTSGLSGVDPETGNPLVVDSLVVVRVKLDQQAQAPKDVERRQDGNLPQVWMAGYACDPALLPPSISKDAVCDCEIDGFGRGKLYLVPVVPKAALVAIDLEDLVGQRLQGWLEVETN
jgi:hypothetical protein